MQGVSYEANSENLNSNLSMATLCQVIMFNRINFDTIKMKDFPNVPGIYCWFDTKYLKYYIGKTNSIRNRVFEYKGIVMRKDGRRLFEYKLQARPNDFEFGIVELCNIQILNSREQYWIADFDCQFPKGYNLTPGGSPRKDNPVKAHEELLLYRKEYRQRDYVKAREKTYKELHKEDIKEYNKDYYNRPEVKERRHERAISDEAKERWDKYHASEKYKLYKENNKDVLRIYKRIKRENPNTNITFEDIRNNIEEYQKLYPRKCNKRCND